MFYKPGLIDLALVITVYFSVILSCIGVVAFVIQQRLNESLPFTILLSGGITLIILQMPIFSPLPWLIDFTMWVVLTVLLYWVRPTNYAQEEQSAAKETSSAPDLFQLSEADYRDWP